MDFVTEIAIYSILIYRVEFKTYVQGGKKQNYDIK